MFEIKFSDAFLWLNWQNCPFNDVFRVEKVFLRLVCDA